MFEKHHKIKPNHLNSHTRTRPVPESKPLRSESAKSSDQPRSTNPGLEPHTPPVKYIPGGQPHLPQIREFTVFINFATLLIMAVLPLLYISDAILKQICGAADHSVT